MALFIMKVSHCKPNTCIESKTDYERLKNMIEEEICKNAESDQDLKRSRPVKNENP